MEDRSQNRLFNRKNYLVKIDSYYVSFKDLDQMIQDDIWMEVRRALRKQGKVVPKECESERDFAHRLTIETNRYITNHAVAVEYRI